MRCWDRAFRPLPRRPRLPQAEEKLYKIAEILGRNEPDATYRRLVSQWDGPGDVACAEADQYGALWDASVAREVPNFVERMQFFDLVTYLPDDIVAGVDRATSARAQAARGGGCCTGCWRVTCRNA